MKHYKSVEILTNFQYQASLHKRKAPLVNTFWRRFSGDSKGGLGGPWPPRIFAWPPAWSLQFFLNFPFEFFWLTYDNFGR